MRNRTVKDVLIEALAFEAAPGEGTDPALLSPQARSVLTEAMEQINGLIGPDNGDDLDQVDSVCVLEGRLGLSKEADADSAPTLAWSSDTRAVGAATFEIFRGAFVRGSVYKVFINSMPEEGSYTTLKEAQDSCLELNEVYHMMGDDEFWEWNNG